jgi:putative transposase
VADPAESRVLREAAVRRLLELDAARGLISAHVQLTASSVGVAERTVWRWLERAARRGPAGPVRGR